MQKTFKKVKNIKMQNCKKKSRQLLVHEYFLLLLAGIKRTALQVRLVNFSFIHSFSYLVQLTKIDITHSIFKLEA